MPSQPSEEIPHSFDTVLVFGQGPIKPVLLPNEMTIEQHRQWIDYQQDIAHNWEPDFTMIQQVKQIMQLKKIDLRTDINEETKNYLKLSRRSEWQHSGWYAMKKWGRQNALAAGFALYKGITPEVILSGGKTIPSWALEHLDPILIQDWPSEAELMKDIILLQYGELYEKKYKRPIEDAIKVEDAATNTIENFSFSINKDPKLIMKGMKVGLVTANYHIKRVSLLANLFCIYGAQIEQFSAQDILKQQLRSSDVEPEEEAAEDISDIDGNPQIDMIMKVEKRWMRGLTEPQYVTYWLGYLGDVNYPTVIQNALNRLRGPEWQEAADRALRKIGVRLSDYLSEDLPKLAKTDPDRYHSLISALKKLKRPEYRQAPPEP